MFEWFPELLKAMNTALEQGAALALVVGLGISILGTQYLKFQFKMDQDRWLNTLALGLGFATTFLMWPVHELYAMRFFLSLLVGLSSPLVYKGVTRLLFWKMPWLRDHLKPVQPVKP